MMLSNFFTTFTEMSFIPGAVSFSKNFVIFFLTSIEFVGIKKIVFLLEKLF